MAADESQNFQVSNDGFKSAASPSFPARKLRPPITLLL
jgi:hypothetical protein